MSVEQNIRLLGVVPTRFPDTARAGYIVAHCKVELIHLADKLEKTNDLDTEFSLMWNAAYHIYNRLEDIRRPG